VSSFFLGVVTFLGVSREFRNQRGVFEKKNARHFSVTRVSWLLWGEESFSGLGVSAERASSRTGADIRSHGNDFASKAGRLENLLQLRLLL